MFGFDLSKRSSPSITGEYVEIEDITKNKITLRIINTPGLKTRNPITEKMQREVTEAIGKLDCILLYCLPVHMHTCISPDDEAIIRNLSMAFGKVIWVRCILLLTFSDIVENNYEQKKELQDITRAFYEHTRSDLKDVKSIFDYGSAADQRIEEFPDMLLAMPVGQRREIEIEVLKDYIPEEFDWTDTFFIEMMKRTPKRSRHVYLCLKYDLITHNAILSAITTFGGVIDDITVPIFGPLGSISRIATSAAIGGGMLSLSISFIVYKVMEEKKCLCAAENIDRM